VSRILYFSNNATEYQDKLQQTNAILIVSFCFIQLSDAILHYALKNNLHDFNLFVSKFIVPTILFSEIPIMYWATFKLTGKRIEWFEYAMAAYCLIGFLSFVLSCNSKTVVGNDGFLVWCGHPIDSVVGKYLFFLGILIATYHYPLNIYKVVFVTVVAATFFYTFYTETFGSGWCHFANILSVIFLAIYFVQKYWTT
jgi:hypothetical protein